MSTPASTTETAPRRRRADAERNRARVLDAARTLFAERGDNVPMEEVAREAGVGIGTLYRHFPTKEAMVEAAAQQRFGDILTYYREVCRERPEPLEALSLLLTHIGETQVRDRGFCSVVEATVGSGEAPGELRAEFEAELVDLIDKGRADGTIREDVEGADILAVTCGLATVVSRASGDWHRFVEIVIAGLRRSADRR